MQAASSMILQNHRPLPVCIYSVKVAALGSLKRVTESIFKISKSFPRGNLKEFDFFINEEAKNCKKNISAWIESIILILQAFKKYLSRDTVRLISLSEMPEKKNSPMDHD